MKRLLAALVVLLVGIGAFMLWSKSPPVCGGTDLFAKLKNEHPRRYDSVLAQAEKASNGEAVFWRIDREGTKPSYLLGTIHVTDPRVADLPDITRKALLGAAVVAVEVEEIADEEKLARALSLYRQNLDLPVGQTLWDFIPDSKESLIRNHPNMTPEIIEKISAYRPWVVTNIVDELPCEEARKDAGIPILDEALAELAVKSSIPVVGLETVEEFFEQLENMPSELQVQELLNAANTGTDAEDIYETIISLYTQRRVAAVDPLASGYGPPEELDMKLTKFMEDEMTERNRIMMRRAEELLAKGNAFIAVGALHLPGEQGLVELIRGAGYKVVPLQ